MGEIYVPLFSALGGALIGAGVAVATVWIQAFHQTKRDRTRLAVEAGIEDHRGYVELAKAQHGTFLIPPLVALIHYQAGYLDLLEKNQVDENAVKELTDEFHRLFPDPSVTEAAGTNQ